MDDDIRERLERLEANEAIRQLASRYALAVDTRDVDALVELFVDDVRVGPDGGTGREAFKRWFDGTLRESWTTSIHGVMNHVIEFESADRAYGVVYCRAEHEAGDKYIVQAMQYWDRYERRDGQWYFERRIPLAWWATDVLERPGGEPRVRWHDRPAAPSELPGWWPSWDEFWSGSPKQGVGKREEGPHATWLARVRRGQLHGRRSGQTRRDGSL